jgi:hypothetical protein
VFLVQHWIQSLISEEVKMQLNLKFLLHIVVASNVPLERHVLKQVSSLQKIKEVQVIASSNILVCV